MWERLVSPKPKSRHPHVPKPLDYNLQTMEGRGPPPRTSALSRGVRQISSEHLCLVNMKKGFGPKVPVGKLTEVESRNNLKGTKAEALLFLPEATISFGRQSVEKGSRLATVWDASVCWLVGEEDPSLTLSSTHLSPFSPLSPIPSLLPSPYTQT